MLSLSSRTALLALAAAAAAHDLSSPSDLDGLVWQRGVAAPTGSRSTARWNRPAKRQSGWEPPSDLATPLREVWDHCLNTYSDGLFGFKNYGWDQLMANDG